MDEAVTSLLKPLAKVTKLDPQKAVDETAISITGSLLAAISIAGIVLPV